MDRQEIAYQEFNLNALNIWPNQWFILGAGDFLSGEYNAMTVAWGSMGTMWRKPFVQVVVRPNRYTFEFMENYHEFSLCAFSSEYQKALNYLGTHSGRESEKISKSGVHATGAHSIAAPVFMEAELIIECKKMYWDDIKPSNFFDPELDKNYPSKDYHRMYFGEIVHIEGVESYIKK